MPGFGCLSLTPLTQVIGIGRACGNIMAASSNFLLRRKFSAIDDLYNTPLNNQPWGGGVASASASETHLSPIYTPRLYSIPYQRSRSAYHPYPVSPRPCMKINLWAWPGGDRGVSLNQVSAICLAKEHPLSRGGRKEGRNQ